MRHVGNLLFRHFICPVIVFPESHGLYDGTVSNEQRKVLIAVSKLLQKMSGGSRQMLLSSEKNQESTLFNSFLLLYQKDVHVFCIKSNKVFTYQQHLD